MSTETAKKPSVLFVCVHNAGRSQMAAAFLTTMARAQIEVRSAGSQPADKINPAAVEAMAELGIDMSAEVPKVLTTEAVKESDVVITMGCGDECPYFPGKRYEDWVLEDPGRPGRGRRPAHPRRDQDPHRGPDRLPDSPGRQVACSQTTQKEAPVKEHVNNQSNRTADHHRFRPRRLHRRHLCSPRGPCAAGAGGIGHRRRRPDEHHRSGKLPRLPRRRPGAGAHGRSAGAG
jgi:arsenate reductase